MHGRFLMLLDRTGLGLDPAESRLLRGSAAKAGLTVRCSTPALLLACSSELDCILLDDGAGALLGRGFERGTNRKVDANALQPLADRQPSAWTERFWGAWLAIVKPAGAVGYAVREPSGLFPAYYAAGEASLFVASDATLLREVRAIGGAIAWPRLASGLVHPDLRVSETALSGCNELIPGCALRLPGLGQELAWSPADHASGPKEVRSLKWSADELRETLQACVAAWSRGSRRLLLELSGGLDSSIVAACLAAAGADVVAATMVSPTPDGDERIYAAAVAEHLGIPLIVKHLDPLQVDFSRSAAAHLPRPSSHAFSQAADALLLEASAEAGADAFICGAGGDNVFGFMGSAAPAADALLASGSLLPFAAALADLALVHDTSVWHAGLLAARQVLLSPFPRRWPAESSLLSRECIAAARSCSAAHPWLAAGTLLPGKRRHVEAILAIQNHLESLERTAFAPLYAPLLSTPVVECCLAVPSWLWNSGGRNRAVARQAFQAMLPASIIERRTKGALTGLSGALLRQHRPVIRELLLEGRLAAERMIDRTAVEALLRDDASFSGPGFHRLLEFAQVEAWSRHWT
ncbi:MAG: asparagine synthase [Alphaproteobacteria bacterium]|nr:MAG: asparagine synthase [Alphaproteobacteria bacterium]